MKNWKKLSLGFVLFLSINTLSAQQTGYACIYSESLCGRTVARGERLDCKKLTAAHRTLKFGTQVLVTNLDNDKSVVVTINDRGPYSKKDIIDLTPAAAKKIGLTYGLGRIKVKIQKVAD
jgi:rare lipoprotein A